MSNLLKLLAAGGNHTPTTDPYFNYVTMLLKATGANASQNNTFLDSSANNFTITRNGNTTQGAFSPFSPTGWSAYFTAGSLNAGSSISFSGDFTLEYWFFPTGSGTDEGGGLSYRNSGFGNGGFQTKYNTATKELQWLFDGGSYIVKSTGLVNGQWNHVTCVRSSGNISAYTNGTRTGGPTAYGTTLNGGTSPTGVYIGDSYDGSHYYTQGNLSNVRIGNTAVYTGASYTVPIAPLAVITGTALLTLQSNRFIDNSSNAYALTVAGSPSIQAFSPFAPSAAYSTSANGGSAYFDGSGDYLGCGSQSAYAAGSGDFTAECFFYPTTTIGYECLLDTRGSGGSTSGWVLTTGVGGTVYIYSGGTLVTSGAGSVTPYAWNHVAYCRASGTHRLLLNGASIGTDGTSRTYTDQTFVIGSDAYASSEQFTGYIASARFIKGTAIYSGAYTVPTAPLTAITNTQLLLNFTNAGIIDAHESNDLETVGNVQVSTGTKKWTASVSLPGGTDYLKGRNNPNLAFGTGDFTIEFWLNPTSVTGQQTLVDIRNASNTGLLTYLYGNVLRCYYGGSDKISGATTISTGSFIHVAVVRYSGNIYSYINGTKDQGPNAFTSNLTDTNIQIGYDALFGGFAFTGYMEDLRISNYARYTTNFTAPTATFPGQ